MSLDGSDFLLGAFGKLAFDKPHNAFKIHTDKIGGYDDENAVEHDGRDAGEKIGDGFYKGRGQPAQQSLYGLAKVNLRHGKRRGKTPPKSRKRFQPFVDAPTSGAMLVW